jgi:hypothetical protein
MRPDSITLAIFEKYSPEELADTATKLVQALTDQETAETEKKTSDAVFKERIGKHAAEANELAHRYSKGGETAQIGCDIRYDTPEVGKKSYIRMDTGETVEVHEMNWEEKQETIQFPLTAQVDAALDKIANSSEEEVTRLCEYPGCIDFINHEGEHRFPKVEAQPTPDTSVETTPEPERKRKRKPHAPPPEPPADPTQPPVGH